MRSRELVYPTQSCRGGSMKLNSKRTTECKTYAIIERYLCGIVQHTQTPFVMEYENADTLQL